MTSPYAIVLALLAALAAGAVGAFAQMRRMALAGDAVSHIALPGLGLAFLCGIHPLIGAAVTLLAGTALIWEIQKKSRLQMEAVVGVVFSAALAVGALVTPDEDLVEALFGGFRKPSLLEFVIAGTASVAVVGAMARFRSAFVLNLFSPELAAAAGLRSERLDLGYLLLFSTTVLLGLRFLGALLAGALIVIPAAVARQWTRRFSPFVLVSSAVSVSSAAAGIALARLRHLAAGPVVVSVVAVAFAASLGARSGAHARDRA